MKYRLENKAYVSDYVHTLTHELKSPLTAIRASGELLEASDLDDDDRLMLSQTIIEQSIKLQSLIDRLLLLAKIEQPTFKLAIQAININQLIQQIIDNHEVQRQQQHVQIDYICNLKNPDTSIFADPFWITQALQNVIDNALYFAHSHVVINVSDNIPFEYTPKLAEKNKSRMYKLESSKPGSGQRNKKISAIEINVFNDGDLIPEYALSKVFDRYFSLSHQHHRPDAQHSNPNSANTNLSNTPLNSDDKIIHTVKQVKKGTGLGLTLVKQVIERHGGQVNIVNIDNTTSIPANKKISKSGVLVTMRLPVNYKS